MKMKFALLTITLLAPNLAHAERTCVAWDVFTGNCIQWSDDGAPQPGPTPGNGGTPVCIAWDVFTNTCIQWK